MKEKFKILDDGTILREDYFFNQVKGNNAQILPFKRKVWKIYLLSLITLGIYGIVIQFAMARENNVACSEDGKKTLASFWGVLGLSIITLGIFGIIWNILRLNREAAYLKAHKKKVLINGASYFFCIALQFFMQFRAEIIAQSFHGDKFIVLLMLFLPVVLAILVLTFTIKQHNRVNRTYNEINNFVEKI